MKIVPEKVSTIASDFDFLNLVLFIASAFFTVAIVGVMLYFAFRYRRRSNEDFDNTPRIYGNHILEIIWTAIPTVVVIFIAWWGIVLREKMFAVDSDHITVFVNSWKWAWEFRYETGKKSSGKDAVLVVPVNKPVKLILTSKDVIHSLFIPAVRVKQDAVPGSYKYMTFTPTRIGEYPIFCTEYCGTQHSTMMAKLRVVSQEEFDVWVNYVETDEGPSAELGKKLYSELGCNACHSLDGSRLVGPSFKGLYGSERELSDGSIVVADDAYILESIQYPLKKLVAGYPPAMPAYSLKDEEYLGLLSFIKEVTFGKDQGEELVSILLDEDKVTEEDAMLQPEQRGARLVQQKGCVACHSLDGSQLVGPSFKGAWGSTREFTDDSTGKVDEEYVRESIYEPNKRIVKGYLPAMPSYQGQLSEEQINDIIEFLKSLK